MQSEGLSKSSQQFSTRLSWASWIQSTTYLLHLCIADPRRTFDSVFLKRWSLLCFALLCFALFCFAYRLLFKTRFIYWTSYFMSHSLLMTFETHWKSWTGLVITVTYSFVWSSTGWHHSTFASRTTKRRRSEFFPTVKHRKMKWKYYLTSLHTTLQQFTIFITRSLRCCYY